MGLKEKKILPIPDGDKNVSLLSHHLEIEFDDSLLII